MGTGTRSTVEAPTTSSVAKLDPMVGTHDHGAKGPGLPAGPPIVRGHPALNRVINVVPVATATNMSNHPPFGMPVGGNNRLLTTGVLSPIRGTMGSIPKGIKLLNCT